MDVPVCRFRLGRALGEASLVVLLSLLGSTPMVPELWPSLSSPPLLFLPGAGLAVFLLLLFSALRWRTQFRIDEQGVEFRRTPGRISNRLAWTEIEELFLLDETQFEVRGSGRQMRFAGPYEELYSAREACLPRLRRIRETLQDRALRDGAVVFRMPAGRWRAHLAYFLAILVLTGITWYCLATLLDRNIRGMPFLLLFFGGSWLWGLRKRASGLGTRVTVRREGLEVRRLDGKDKIPWDALERTEWNEHNGINLVLRSRRVISLPPSLANIGLLEEFLHEGRRVAESDARDGAEGRTMMQSP